MRNLVTGQGNGKKSSKPKAAPAAASQAISPISGTQSASMRQARAYRNKLGAKSQYQVMLEQDETLARQLQKQMDEESPQKMPAPPIDRMTELAAVPESLQRVKKARRNLFKKQHSTDDADATQHKVWDATYEALNGGGDLAETARSFSCDSIDLGMCTHEFEDTFEGKMKRILSF